MSSDGNELISRMNGLRSLLEKMICGDLDIRLPMSDKRDELDAIAFGINVLAGEIRYRQEQLIQTEKFAALGKISAGLAHEINNPLAIIRGYLEQFVNELSRHPAFQSDKVNENLDRIDRAVDRIVGVVQSIKNFSRPTTGEFLSVDLREVIRSARSLLDQQMRMKQIVYVERFPDHGVYVSGEFSALERVLVNVFSNSIDAIEMNGDGSNRKIETQVLANERRAYVNVADTGAGVDGELIKKVFDPFFTTKEVGKGTGLGLAISQSIISAHGGRIGMKRNHGAGVTVHIELPLEER